MRSSGDLVFVGESAEDGLAADPVVREVDRRWRPGLGLHRRQLAEPGVRPGLVPVDQVGGQGPAQVLFVDDSRMSSCSNPANAPMTDSRSVAIGEPSQVSARLSFTSRGADAAATKG